MIRTIEQWYGCESDDDYAIDDAKYDIATLYHLAERVALLNKDAGEIGAGMLANLVEEAQRIIGCTDIKVQK